MFLYKIREVTILECFASEQYFFLDFCSRDWAVQAEGKGSVGNSSTLALPHIGGLFSDPDVHSLWSFK